MLNSWVLVFITVNYSNVTAEAIGNYDNMTDCFFAREKFSQTVGGNEGYFPLNTQAVCIKLDNKEKKS